VLSGVATDLERDVPFAVFVDALDQYLAGLEPPGLSVLDPQVQAELAHVFPSLWTLGAAEAVAPQHERYRSHRAIRALLEHLAAARPLLLLLDDLHWADPASVELLGALLRRPPAAPVALALALRPLRMTERLPVALERARRSDALDRIELDTLSVAEARELLGASVPAAATAALYEETGGNPFYLQQVARSFDRARSGATPAMSRRVDIGVPSAVAASLSEELALLSENGRRVFEGAAVAGDPFEPELVAAASATSDAAVMEAIDELLQRDLIRETDVPRRFRFRHPLVRRAAYESTAAGWRAGAHERCAVALAARGASASARAHHVERSGRPGDVAAVAVLREAGDSTLRLAPESAARWLGSALRLLPDDALVEQRVELQLARAMALAAAGRFSDSHDVLLEAIAIVPEAAGPLATTIATACARQERFLGQYEQAHRHLEWALARLPDEASVQSAGLLIELTLNDFYRSRYAEMDAWSARALQAAETLPDPALMAAAVAMAAVSQATTGRTAAARAHQVRAAALVDALPDADLAARLDGAAWLAAAELYLDLFAEADTHATRVLSLARATGPGDPFGLYAILPRIWYVRGKLRDAVELLDGAIEGGRLLGTPPGLAGNLFNRSVVALAMGDLDSALSTATEAAELARELGGGFVSAWAAVRLASVLLETGQPARAVGVLLDGAGGDALANIPGGWRAYCLELLVRCWLALERRAEAELAVERAALAAATTGLPLAAAWADRAAAAVALASGDTVRAVERALASATAADAVGAPIEAALSRTLAGRALASAGQAERAVAELQNAAATFDRCGAYFYRADAERALGKLGRRPYRRSRPGSGEGIGLATLTDRELEVARLVVDRRTNPEIAAELFLSLKTVETHMRNIFNKSGVSTRVELARAIERAER
jgi:ATP/maltotriose-dependent transcriptional regulator MalT